ncbi:MAG: Xaa-Pro dipeptidase [Woeseiaceae bacterium]|nr:Xaa-Pro dipeptidase [Woeseiaceae bacterium]
MMPSLETFWNTGGTLLAALAGARYDARMTADYSDRNPELGSLYAAHLAEVMARHDDALEKSGAAHLVVFSGCPTYAFLDDNTYPFRANPHFVSWAPLTALPLSYIVYTPGETPVLVYYQPKDYWHVVPGAPSGYWTNSFDIRVVHESEAAAEHLPAERDKCILVGEIHDDAHAFGIERVNPSTTMNLLHYARGQKTPYELACMRLASRRGVSGHRAAEGAFRDGASEFAIHQAYCQAVSHADNELPYNNIIALNEHGAVLHYTDLERQAPDESRSFLIDAGAQVHGYACDITRTYSKEDGRFADLVQRMDVLQQAITDDIRAGVDYRDLQIKTHALIGEVLVETELASGSAESLIGSGVTSAFFPHGLGHLLGIQVHDVGGFMENESGTTIDPPSGHPFLRLTRELLEDMVLTVEPGLYVIDMLLDNLRGTAAEHQVNWDTVAWLRPYGGVRIEDNVRVLADGVENFTRDAFAL